MERVRMTELWLPHSVEMSARASVKPLTVDRSSEFMRLVTDCCERECSKPKSELIERALERGGVVERFTHEMAAAAAGPPETIEYKTDKGKWIQVDACDAVEYLGKEVKGDAQIVHQCAEEFTGDYADGTDLDESALYQMIGRGRGVGTKQTVDGAVTYGIAAPSAVKSRTKSRKIVGWTWDRGEGTKVKLNLDEVNDFWFPNPDRDHESWSPWCPAIRSIEFCAQIDRLLSLKVGEHIMIGGVIYWNLPKDPDTEGGVPGEVVDFKRHAEKTRNRVDTTTPYITGGAAPPEYVRLAPEMQAELLELKEAKNRDAARESPVEMGAFLEGEMSGNDWQASLRERYKWQAVVGPQRRRWARQKWRWIMKPKLQDLFKAGEMVTPATRWRYGYDPAGLVNRADNLPEVQKGVLHGSVGASAERRALGLTDADAPKWEDGKPLSDIEVFLCLNGKGREELAEIRRQVQRDNNPHPGTEVFDTPPSRSEPTTMPSPRSRAALPVELTRIDPCAGLSFPPHDPCAALTAPKPDPCADLLADTAA